MSGAFPAGRGSQLTLLERQEIQQLGLIDGLGPVEIARRTGRDRSTVRAVLNAEDSVKLREHLESDHAEEAKRLLRKAQTGAARQWERSIAVAAERGDHRPAKDLLLHTNVIQPLESDGDRGNHVRVQVIVGTPGAPFPYDPVAAPRVIEHARNEESNDDVP